ncbi:MAG: RluA family pseudouridine synthase [Sneathiellaceae bacterium]
MTEAEPPDPTAPPAPALTQDAGPDGLRFRIAPAPEEAGARLDRLLARYLAGTEAAPSRERIKALIAEGAVSREPAGTVPPGAARTIGEPSYRVKPGECYSLLLPPAVAARPEAQDIPLSILFEDAHLIVVDKPAGLVVHPAPGNPDLTLVNALLRHCGDSLSGINGVRRPGIVHRLDKETSGVMVAAKTDAAHRGLAALFEAHDLEREYLALAWGRPMPPVGRIDAPLGRDPRLRTRMAVHSGQGSRQAATHYRLLKTFTEGEGGMPLASLIACRLETGRTHQIRVHLAHIGHPVVGDPLYGRQRRPQRSKGGGAGGDGAAALMAAFPRQALHAAMLGFRHPVTAEAMRFETPPPADLAALLAALEAAG